MANILPTNTTLPQVQEGAAVQQTFTAQLDATETLKSLNITAYEETPGITVDGASYSGTYSSVFNFSGDALSYREGDELKTASAWDQLPESGADLYLWRAPTSLQKTFKYTVEMVYIVTTESSPGESGGTTTTETEETITQTYSQLVYGNWSKWADQLRAYVYKRG